MDIVEELRQDREAGAKRLESEYRAGLLAMARRLCSDLSDADELVNRTFAAVVAGIDDYLEQSAFFGWMCRIMINLNSADRRRRSDRDVTYPGDLPETPDDAAHEAIYRDVDASILRDAINTLPKEMKEAIVMHYLMEQPVARIAKFLALPVSTVKWRIHCARVELTRRLTSSAKKPGVKAVLLALALSALAAVGAVGVAAIRSAAEPAAKVESSASSQPVAESEPASEEHQATEAQPAAEEPPISAEPPETAAEVAVAEPLISQEQEEQSMNKNTRPSILAAALAAALPVASAFPSDAGNFVWNGGFEESYIYWANGISANPYSLRTAEYGNINTCQARLEHWTGSGGITDKDAASSAPHPNDTSLYTGERCFTIYKSEYVEQTLELPVAGTYEVSFRHCMRKEDKDYVEQLTASMIDETGATAFSSGNISPGASVGTYTGTATITAAGRYRLRIEGQGTSKTVCIDDVSVVLKDATSPFGAVDLKLPRYDRVQLKVRPLDYGQGDDLTQVDYRIAKHGQSFGPGWTAISAGLAKETELAHLVTGLQIDTDYDLEVRFSAAGGNFIAATSFRTTKELLLNGGFDELPDFLSVSTSLYKNVEDCNDCPWFGIGEVANRARASASNVIAPKASSASGLITGNVYGFIWKNKDLKQSITVPVNGTYKVAFKYAAAQNYNRSDHSTAVEVVSEAGVTTTLFVESGNSSDYTLHQCEREVTLPAGNLTFQMRGIPPDDIGIATCYDDISLQLVEANVNPALTLSTSGESIDRVTLDLNLSALGAPDAIVDIAIAFAPTNQPIGDYYEPILSGLSAPGIYTATIAGLDMNVTYACRLCVRNNIGGETFVNGTFSTPASIIGNGGFEEGSSIASGNVGDLYDNHGVWPATTTVWKVNAVKAVYNNGISKPNTYFTPNANFTLGGYSGFIWKEGSFEQDIIVPLTSRYRLGFRYGLASNYSPSINIEVNIAQNGVTNTVWSINNVTAKTTQFVPDNTIANLVQGPATFTIKQTINSTASTSGCYDDITLMPPAKEWTNEVVVVSQNPAVTGGMKPAPQVYADPAAGWAQTFSADGTWTDPSTGDKYTCTGWKLYRNGALVDQKASLNCAYVHPAGADDRIVWGWKPWAPSDRILGGQGFFIRVF